MARKALMLRAQRPAKYSTRKSNCCHICGRPRGYMRYFDMCRICFRLLARRGLIPGVRKSSW